MSKEGSLAGYNIIAFVPIVDAGKAREFYQGTLGLTLQREELPFALVFDAGGIMLRLAIVGKPAPAPWTVLGWEVPDIAASVNTLGARGVRFERYPGMNQDENGIWNSPSGARVAWFKDPEGNVLGLTQFPKKDR